MGLIVASRNHSPETRKIVCVSDLRKLRILSLRLTGSPYSRGVVKRRSDMAQKTILVTGSTGWLGGKLCEALVARGVNVVGLARRDDRGGKDKSGPGAHRTAPYEGRATSTRGLWKDAAAVLRGRGHGQAPHHAQGTQPMGLRRLQVRRICARERIVPSRGEWSRYVCYRGGLALVALSNK